MNKINLKNTDIEIAPLIFGGNVFGWTIDEKRSHHLLDIFSGNGFNCIDTADSYSTWKEGNKGGESEKIIGSWMKKSRNRNEIIIATKVGAKMPSGQKGLSKKYILSEVETSLKRLQTDYIDLYQSHYDDPETPLEETLEAYQQLISEGKVRYIGASNFSAERLEESLNTARKKNLPQYTTFQPKYNLYDREFETEYADVVKKYELSVITYYSLASGFLTGKYRSEKDFAKSARGHGIKKYLNEKGFAILKVIEELSKKYACPYATIALAWLIQNPLVTAPIASATNETQLKELMQSTEINVSKTDIDKLNAAGI
jgi:aryl-alcohol dehydrogenase-like predicted oxidoreductase